MKVAQSLSWCRQLAIKKLPKCVEKLRKWRTPFLLKLKEAKLLPIFNDKIKWIPHYYPSLLCLNYVSQVRFVWSSEFGFFSPEIEAKESAWGNLFANVEIKVEKTFSNS